MKKSNKMITISCVIGTAISAGIAVWKIKQLTSSLRYLRIIDKDTKILNVYTYDYVKEIEIGNEENLGGRKNGIISHVYTDRAMNEWIYDIFARPKDSTFTEEEFRKSEMKQVEKFAKELNKVAPNATLVIRVATKEEAHHFLTLKVLMQLEEKFSIEIRVLKEENIFDED